MFMVMIITYWRSKLRKRVLYVLKNEYIHNILLFSFYLYNFLRYFFHANFTFFAQPRPPPQHRPHVGTIVKVLVFSRRCAPHDVCVPP